MRKHLFIYSDKKSGLKKIISRVPCIVIGLDKLVI